MQFLLVLGWLHRALMAVAVAIGIIMMLHVSAEVVARGVFGHSLPAVGEITASYYMIVVAFMPLAFISYSDTHIRADLFTRMMSLGMQRVLAWLVDLLTIAYLAVLGWQGIVSAMKRTDTGEMVQIPGGFLPIWPARWLVPIALFAMILAMVLRMIERMGSPDQGEPSHDTPIEEV